MLNLKHACCWSLWAKPYTRMLRLHHALPLGYRYRGYGPCSRRHRMSECHLLHDAQAVGYGYGGFMCSALYPQRIGFAGASTTPSLFPPPLWPLPLSRTRTRILFLSRTLTRIRFLSCLHVRAASAQYVCTCIYVSMYVCMCVCIYLCI